MADISEDKIRQIIREETAGEFNSLHVGFKQVKEEMHNQGVLLEEVISRFDKNIDLLTEEMKVKKQVDAHEERITGLESGQQLLKSAVQAK